MSKMKLFLQVVEDVQALADSLEELVVAMQTNEPDRKLKHQNRQWKQNQKSNNQLLKKSVVC